MSRKSHFQIGIGAIAFAVFLILIGIPYGITSPSNVRFLVLSPVFWPYTLAGLLAIAGLGMVLTSRMLDNQGYESFLAGIEGGPLRLALLAVLLVGYVLVMPFLGMVWASMIAFVLLAFLIKTHHPVAAVVAGIAVPLILYAFFAHVAGVAVPQGELVRLP